MAAMRWPGPYIVKYAFDIYLEVAMPLWKLHGPPPPGAVFKIGAAGNILEEDISQWDRVDGTVAGPPCPPYSMIGARHGKDDPRAAVHARVTDILVDQGWKHSFFFIVEQVPGMMTLRSTGSGDCSRSDWDDWIDELKQWAPMWRVFPWTLNASAWLPHNRPRIYTVGLHASLATRHILPPPTPANPCLLLDVLHPGLPRAPEVGLTAQQLENLVVAKDQAKRYPRCLATVSLDRNPSAQWSTAFGVHGVVNAPPFWFPPGMSSKGDIWRIITCAVCQAQGTMYECSQCKLGVCHWCLNPSGICTDCQNPWGDLTAIGQERQPDGGVEQDQSKRIKKSIFAVTEVQEAVLRRMSSQG